jgi:hypothetical protein
LNGYKLRFSFCINQFIFLNLLYFFLVFGNWFRGFIYYCFLSFNNGKEKQQSIPIAKTILKDINENTNIELVEPSTFKREKTIINKSPKPIAKNKEKIEKIEENKLVNAETKSELIAIQISDTIKLVANNLIEYVEVFEPKPKIDTIYIYTNWLCKYEKTPTKQPYQRIQNSIRGFLANK